MTTSIPRPVSAKNLRKIKTNITLGLVFVLLLSFTLYTLAFLDKKATRDVSIGVVSNLNFDIKQTSTFSGRNSSPTEPELCSNVGKTTLFDTQPTLTGELYDELEWMDTLNYTVDNCEKTCQSRKQKRTSTKGTFCGNTPRLEVNIKTIQHSLLPILRISDRCVSKC